MRRVRRWSPGLAPRVATLAAVLSGAAACVPATEAPLDTSGFATLITGDFASGAFVPRLIDLGAHDTPLAFPVADGQLVPLGLWRASPEALRLPAEVVAAPVGGCPARRLALESADRRVCLTGDGLTDCPAPLDPRAAVETLPWTDPDPCQPWVFDASFTRRDFEVQTTTMTQGGIASGAVLVLVPLARGRMVIGQLSDGVPRTFARNTELAVVSTTDLADVGRVPHVRDRASFTAGAPRGDDEAWLGTSDGRLAVLDADTLAIRWVIRETAGLGAISDLATHPLEPERVYAVTQTCGLYVREPDAASWTVIQPSLRLRSTGPGTFDHECGARITVLAPGEALVGGLPAERVGQVNLANFTANRDLVLRVRGATAAAERPWPDDVTDERRLLKIYAVAQFVDTDGRLTEVALGGRYTAEPDPTQVPFFFGVGRNMVFTRRRDPPGEPWTMRPAFPELDADGDTLAPVVFSDAHGASGEDTRSHFRGFFAGATLTLFAAEDLRLRRGAADGLVKLSSPWSAADTVPQVARVRPDGDGGFVITAGNHAHWWRPR